MPGDTSEMMIDERILRCLRDFFPVKADKNVVIPTVQRIGDGGSIDQISEHIRFLRDQGWIEESISKTPSGKRETFQLKITPSGIEHLRFVEMRGIRELSLALTEVKNQQTINCDQINADIQRISQDLERSKKDLLQIKELVVSYAGKVEAEKLREERLIIRVLCGNEKAIYQTILDAGGEMLQKDLVARTKMSNAKISRTIDHLESRGILTKERHGATNRLRIIVNPLDA